MPRLQTLLSRLNHAFGEDDIKRRSQSAELFAPGAPLDRALAEMVSEEGSEDHKAFRAYVRRIPPALREGLRSTIYCALQTSPPTLITCSWAPGYDFEASYWQAPDTPETKGGITVLFRSRYPSDPHPLRGKGPS
jgi:hypothetical protein